jgi:hypothetical protein
MKPTAKIWTKRSAIAVIFAACVFGSFKLGYGYGLSDGWLAGVPTVTSALYGGDNGATMYCFSMLPVSSASP